MEFTLTYQGPLKANGSKKDKHNIRQIFHKQLSKLWTLPPLNVNAHGPNDYFLEDNPPEESILIIKKVKTFRFAPLVTSKLNLIAEIKVIMLRPEPPGFIVTQGGDIDNRLKTLFDAFRVPMNHTELPKGITPKVDENPFFCLLEDDKLITKISMETDTLLDPDLKPPFVQLLVKIKTKATQITFNNIDLA